MRWQLQEAKQKLSQLVRRAIDEGPQVVTRYGETIAVVVSADEYHRLTGSKPDFAEFILSGSDLSALDLDRVQDRPREIDLADSERRHRWLRSTSTSRHDAMTCTASYCVVPGR